MPNMVKRRMSDMPVDKPVDPTRSRIMKAILSKDTRPEMAVRRLMHSMGYRFRLHARDLPGSPDLVFRRRKKAIFVHGCFWHRHEGCRKCSTPATRAEWWAEKLERNVRRDRRSVERLSEMGWESLIIWECEVKDGTFLKEMIRRFLGEGRSYPLQSSIAVDSRPADVGFVTPHEADAYETAKDSERQERGSSMTTRQKPTNAQSEIAAAESAAPTTASSDIGTKQSSRPRKQGTKQSARPKASRTSAAMSSPPVDADAAKVGGTISTKTAKKSATKPSPRKQAAKKSAPANVPAVSTARTRVPRAKAVEHSLPKSYSAATDANAGTVTITRGSGSASIRMQSFASVANVLTMVEEGSHGLLEPTAQLDITDPFSGKKATIAAAALTDVAKVLSELAMATSAETGTGAATTPARAAIQPKAVSKTAKPKQVTKTPAAAKAPHKAAARTPAKAAHPKAAKSTVPAQMPRPDWYADLKDEYVSDAANYRLVRAEVAVDPTSSAKARKVTGRWGEAEGNHAWGYEILSGDRHVAWVVAEDQRTFILTGAPGFAPSTHRMVEGLMARVTATVMPQFAKVA